MSEPSATRPPRPVRPVGDAAVLIECADADDAGALAAWAAGRFGVALRDVVPAMRTVLLVAADAVLLASIAREASMAQPARGSAIAADPVRIDVAYDGEDLADCAGMIGVSVEALIRGHLAAHWRVAFIGFAPGFAYLIADDWPHRLPRHTAPRPRVPAGAVALADGFSGVYPGASPGGWQLIGRTSAQVWDVDATPPTPFAPGVRVRFTSGQG